MSEPRTPEEIIARIQLDEDDGLDIFEIMQRYRTDGSCEHTIRKRLEDLPAMAQRVIQLDKYCTELESGQSALNQMLDKLKAERDKLAAQVEEQARAIEQFRRSSEEYQRRIQHRDTELITRSQREIAKVEELHAECAAHVQSPYKAGGELIALRKELMEAKELLSEARYEGDAPYRIHVWTAQVGKLLANAPEEPK